MANKEPEVIIESEVLDVIESEKILNTELSALESELREADPKFQLFIEKQAELRALQAKNADIWKSLETQMVKANVKSIKGDWGSITIAERLNWVTTDELPAKYYKKVVDTTKLSNDFRLKNIAPKGAVPNYTKYLTKRIK